MTDKKPGGAAGDLIDRIQSRYPVGGHVNGARLMHRGLSREAHAILNEYDDQRHSNFADVIARDVALLKSVFHRLGLDNDGSLE